MSGRGAGQVLVSLAIVLPLLLIPVLAFAVEGSYLAERGARLAEVTAQAAEDAAQQIDAAVLRSDDLLKIDPQAALQVAQRDLAAADPQAQISGFQFSATALSVMTTEVVPVRLAYWIPAGRVTLTAAASARLSAGYSSPSSRIPFPVRIL